MDTWYVDIDEQKVNLNLAHNVGLKRTLEEV